MQITAMVGTFLGLVATAVSIATASSPPEPLDLAIRGGRVIDPETGLDAVRNVGIEDGRVLLVSEDPVEGRDTIDARGLVVAPGFVDLNNHDVGPDYFRMKARDGVTSVLVLESGAVDVDAWYASHDGKAVVHYGVGADTGGARMLAANDPNMKLRGGMVDAFPSTELANRALSPAELARSLEIVAEGLAEGALAVSMGIEYLPGMTHSEVLAMFRLAAAHGAFVFAHIRDWDETRDHGEIYEMLAASVLTGAPAHLTHLNSMGDVYTKRYLEMLSAARSRGVDLTTDGYPYTAGLTGIEATFFDDWETWGDEAFARFQWAATGEWLDRESFGRYRESGGWVIIHSGREEWVRAVVAHPEAMVASDGAWDDGKGHPRGAGTFARVLGRYVREVGLLDLSTALRKMTLLPARRLEGRVPEMRRKGRIQAGSDADLVIFDPETVVDRATYTEPTLPPVGIRHVLVAGVPVVREGAIVDGVFPGKPIRGRVSER